MQSNSEAAEILYELESEGHKLTRLREVLIILFTQGHPLLVEELVKQLKKQGILVHRTTLYRELEFLEKKQVITRVNVPGNKLRYEFADGHHHHHVVCTQCRKIEDIELDNDADELEKLIKNKKNFSITRHALEFFGLCGTCKNV